MTGFGRAERQAGPVSITAEVRSYNNRFLDITVSAFQARASMEQALRTLIADHVSRGRVELHIRVSGEVSRQQVSSERAMVAADLLRSVARAAGLTEEISVQDLLAADRQLEIGVFQEDDTGFTDDLCAGVLEATRCCLQRLDVERKREGVELEDDLLACLDRVERSTETLDAMAAELQDRLEQDMKTRIGELLAQDDVAGDRVVPAVALLLARSDVHEELKRLHAHLDGIRGSVATAGPHGKKLEFYCQELLREANTVISKSSSVGIDAQVIIIKESLERMREQLRNVE